MFGRRNSSESAIGWISTVDSLLLGFGLMVVLALHSANTQHALQDTAKAITTELSQTKSDLDKLGAETLEWQKQVDRLKSLQDDSETTVKNLNADLIDMAKAREELEEHAQMMREQLDAATQGVEGISQQLGSAIRERESLKKQQAESDRQLLIARSETEDAKQKLSDASAKTTATQEERNSLEARLNEMRAMLLTLEARQRQTTMQSDELKQEADRLKVTVDDKTRNLQEIQEALSTKEHELRKLMADRLEEESLLTNARIEANQLKSKLDESSRHLATLQKEKAVVEGDQRTLSQANSELKKQVIEAQAAAQRGKQLQEQLETKSKELDRLQRSLKEAEDGRRTAESNAQREANARGQAAATDVLGFKGAFRNVVFVIDISHSMTHISDPERPGWENDVKDPRRWNKTKREILAWARNLPMDTLRLVLFHSEVFQFPEAGGVYSMKGHDRADSVRAIEAVLNDRVPTGQTNTLGALRVAYGYRGTDTMVLFTDGYPVVEGRKTTDLIVSVRGLVRQHRDIPVNVVGIGEYFEKSFADFLRDIATTTGGEFIGR